MMSLSWVLVVIFGVWVTETEGNVVNAVNDDVDNKFLLMLFDGFRWDYFGNFSDLPNFDRFRKQGVHAEYMTPNYPSLSYPGYYSILTGRYVESHGFLENTMYDKYQDMFFWTDTDVNGSMSFWWNYTQPLWVTSVKAGLKTFVYHWPGCHVQIDGVLPTYYEEYKRYNDTEELKSNILSILQNFSNGAADVGIIYSEYTDMVGHHAGPESAEMKFAVKEVDKAIGLLLDQLKDLQLTDKVNVILVSDHGMTDVSSAKRIRLDDVIDMDDVVHLLGFGSATGIEPVSGRLQKVYNDLKNLTDVYVWKAEEIPDDLHYKNHYRVPPLLVAAKPNVFIDPIVNNSKQVPPITEYKPYLGYHGYLPSDSKDMGAIFLGLGPDFKANYSASPISMVDPYNLMTNLLGIEGLPNNGSWGKVKEMITSDATIFGASVGMTGGAPNLNYGYLPSLLVVILCAHIFSHSYMRR